MQILHYLSILLELLVAIMGLQLHLKKKPYGILIFLTFGIYVFYDLANFFRMAFSADFLYLIFFIASVSAFLTVRQLLNIKK